MDKLTQKRDTTIDCMKGIAITLMVMGHSGFPFSDFLALFHMAVFFMISGYLWNDKYAQTVSSAKQYVLRKIKTLWLPFVLWNLSMLLCSNLLLSLHIFTDDPSALALSDNIPIHTYLTGKEMVKPAIKMLFFRTDLELGGATWFLAALFIVSILHLAVRFVCRHMKHGETLFYGISFAVLIYCQLCCMGLKIPGKLMIRRAFFAYLPFLMGYYFRRIQNLAAGKKYSLFLFILSAGLLVTAFHLKWTNSVNDAVSENVLVYGLLTASGWFLCRIPSLYCPEKLKEGIVYLGKHTLCIVLCHFLAFRIVSWLYVLITGAPSVLIASFPIIVTGDGFMWVIYTVSGMAVSLLLGFAGTKIKFCLLSRLKHAS